jgi:hypothetical protein
VIYGETFEADQRRLFKYFVKSFGCRLVAAGREVPHDLVALLPEQRFSTGLKITFAVNEDLLLLQKKDRGTWIGKGDLFFWQSKSDPKQIDGYVWQESVSWLRVCYWYMLGPESDLGSTWIADTQTIYLGSIAPLSPDDRRSLIESLATAK